MSEVTGQLGDAGVDIRGFSVPETAGYSILRLVVDKPTLAYEVLEGAGFGVREEEIICIDLPDRPGGLAGTPRSSC